MRCRVLIVALGLTAGATALASSDETEDVPRSQTDLGTTPLYNQLRDAEREIRRLREKADAFEFHGYLRSGFGLDSRGGQQVAFQAPGAGAKYRLGNETDTYAEAILVNNWLNPSREADQAWLSTELMVQADTTQSSNYSSTDRFRLREAFVKAGGLFRRQPRMQVWAGQRYYRRQDIHINDFFSVDISGYGGGLQDLDLGFGQFALAVLGGANEEAQAPAGRYAKANVDLRLYDIAVPLGRLSLWFNLAHTSSATTPDGMVFPRARGWALGIKHLRPRLLGGYNNLIVTYATGVAANIRTEVPAPTPFRQDARTLLVTEHVLVQPSHRFAAMAAVVYQRRRTGNPAEGTATWLSFGARPIAFLSEHFSIAAEGGMDFSEDSVGTYQGWLRKVTLAPQVGAGHEFFSRPVLRLYTTYASWTGGFQGRVGGPGFATRRRGLSYGLQGEAWW